MAKINRRRTITKAIIQFGLAGLVKIAMLLIILVALITTYLGALTTAKSLGYIGFGAATFSLLPDALMVLSAARMRQTGLSPHQRKHAQRSMRFGLSFSVLTNMISAFLIMAPNGTWIDISSSRAVWMQHMIFALTIMWHAAPVVILWYATEMITRPRVEPASLQDSSIIKTITRARKPVVPQQNPKISTASI